MRQRFDMPHSPRCAALLRGQAATERWTGEELARQIADHCGHSLLRSHRLARGWTIAELIMHLQGLCDAASKLTAARVSKWETGQDSPSAVYETALCKVYRTNPVIIGLASDFGDHGAAGLVDQTHVPAMERPADSERRKVLQGFLMAGGVLGLPGIDAVASVRRLMDETLSGSTISDSTVSYWEDIAQSYGRTYKSRPTLPFLVDIIADFTELQLLTDQRLPSGPRRDLCAVAGQLAGLVSMVMTNLSQYREARGWVHTARLAADEAGDPELRAWVATREAVAHLHFGDPHAACTSARHAQLLVYKKRCSPAAMAPAIEARALGVQGDIRGAKTALQRAESVFAQLEPQANVAYAFTQGQMHFYASNALTAMGDTSAAGNEQRAALAAFGPQERLDPTLVHLDRASCIIQDGDVVGGAAYATETLLRLQADYRPGIILNRARAVHAAIPAGRQSLPAVRDFIDVLALGGSSEIG